MILELYVDILVGWFTYYFSILVIIYVTQSVPMLHVAIHIGGSLTLYSNIVTGLYIVTL